MLSIVQLLVDTYIDARSSDISMNSDLDISYDSGNRAYTLQGTLQVYYMYIRTHVPTFIFLSSVLSLKSFFYTDMTELSLMNRPSLVVVDSIII